MKLSISETTRILAAVAIASLITGGCAAPGARTTSETAQATLPPPSAPPASPTGQAASITAAEALDKLMAGNQRFVEGRPVHPRQELERRAALAKGQTPFAIVLTCSDSRVAPELYFDQGLGDLFVIRNAGNVIDDHALGSMEYAFEHLGARLVIVVGHSKCGAVSAAVGGGHAPGHVQSIVDSIAPAALEVKDAPGDKVDNAVRANARRVAESASRSEPILAEAVHDGKLTVLSARYDLETGKIEILK